MRRHVCIFIGAWVASIVIGVGINACTPVNIQPVASNCVPIVKYSAEWQAAFADELAAIHTAGKSPHVEQYIIDSTRTRQALKVCQ